MAKSLTNDAKYPNTGTDPGPTPSGGGEANSGPKHMNEGTIRTNLEKIKDLAQCDDYEAAWRILEKLTIENPGEYRIWATRAYIHSRQGDTDTAIIELSKALTLCDKEPHPFYTRGILFFETGRYVEAAADFTRVIKLCDYYKSDYYREGAYFFRADANLRLGKVDEAVSDCTHVRDGMQTWTDRVRTKESILAECSKGVRRQTESGKKRPQPRRHS